MLTNTQLRELAQDQQVRLECVVSVSQCVQSIYEEEKRNIIKETRQGREKLFLLKPCTSHCVSANINSVFQKLCCSSLCALQNRISDMNLVKRSSKSELFSKPVCLKRSTKQNKTKQIKPNQTKTDQAERIYRLNAVPLMFN